MRMMISIILLSAVPAGWALSTGASSITAVQTYGSFETAGITIRVDGMDFDETAMVEYKRSADPDYQNGHDFVRYDGNHMATSLFRLESNTTYDVRVTLIDPDGVTGANPVVTSVSTRPDYSLPAPLRVVTVSTQTELNTAAAAAQPGDEIRMAAGTYPDGIAVSGRTGSEGHPIVVTSQTGTRPLLQGDADGGVTIEHSAYWVLDNLEVHNEDGDGIRFRGCHSMVIRRCYVHDSRPGDYTNNVFICHGEESDPPYAGNYLIEHNVISDEVHDTVDENQGPGESNINVAGQSYFGIHLDYQPGGFTTIRGNTIYGTVDGIHPTGDEGQSPVMGPDDPDVLDSWHDQNLDLYDNVIYDCKDDAIECDGHMVNGRIFRNRLGKCENAISTAPFYPGPLFVVRNFIHGFHQGCFKQNTGVDGVTRKVHFYHNTVREKPRASPQHCGSEYCLYRGEPSYQQGFVYLNNIFFGRGRVYNGDLYGSGQYHRYDTFDYNLIYSTRQTDTTYACKWVCQYGDPLNNTKYVDLPSFRASVGQELHGLWGDPRLDTTLLSGYPAVSKLLDLRILAGSPAIDHGLPIPGINDGFLGTAPDIGAVEYDSAIYPPSTPANPYPANGATGVIRDPTLTWSSTGATSYDVYGGPTSSPVKIATVTTPSYAPGTLPALTKYYWKIVAKNAAGSTPGPLWDFTTGSVVFHSVSTPTAPSGPSHKDKNLTCTFATGGSICNLGHGVQYRFDWGDGQYSTYGSSSASHSWSSYGTYSIRAQARCATDNNVVSSWSAIKAVNIAGGEFLSSGSWTGAGHGTDGWYVGDFNGDGKDDIFRYIVGTSGADVFLSGGTKFVYSGSWTGAGHGTDGWYIGDFNGDGKDDIFRYVPGTSGADVFLSSGTKFVYSGSWTGAGHGTDGWYVGDFNGDGKDDIFRYVPGTSGADVFLSSGTKFVYSGSWTGAGHGTDGWYVGDFNGDGKDDIFRYVPGTSGADVFLSDGIKFVYSGSWTGAGHGDDGWYVGDFNGDGKDDIFRYVSGVSGAQVYFSTGTAFVYMGSWTGAGHGTDGWYAGDFNGDLKADIFRYVPGTSGAEVFLSHFPISSLPFVSGEPILAFDEDMMLDIQGTRETKMSYREEEELLKPYFQRLMNGDEPTIYEIKSALEERVGDRVRKIVINQLLYRHAYWRLVEGLQRTKEER
jgi:hypothetical protein